MSIGPNDASNVVINSSTSNISITNNSLRTRRAAADQQVDLFNDNEIITSESEIENKIFILLNKSNASNKDFIAIISQMLSILIDQMDS